MLRNICARPSPFVLFLLITALACDAQPNESSAGVGAGTTTQSMLVPLDEPVRPRWILRDKDGAVVPALVEPYCGAFEHCGLPDIGASPQFRCVHVAVFKDRYIGLLYGLADGALSSCPENTRPLSPYSSCSQQPGCGGPFFWGELDLNDQGFRPHAPRDTYLHDGKLLYVSTSKAPVDVQCFYTDPVDGCVQSQVVSQLFPLLPVPDEFVDLLADGAPYTFEVVYD